MPEAQFQNIKRLAANMVKNPEVQTVFTNLYCQPSGLADQSANDWFTGQAKLWADLSKQVQSTAK
jgi:tripartite-type tricarboxylate transporter receptor subunit TctC